MDRLVLLIVTLTGTTLILVSPVICWSMVSAVGVIVTACVVTDTALCFTIVRAVGVIVTAAVATDTALSFFIVNAVGVIDTAAVPTVIDCVVPPVLAVPQNRKYWVVITR